MKRTLMAIAVAVLLPLAPTATSAGDETAAIRAAALDYIEGWYDGDAARMERAIHPDLVKRRLDGSGGGGELNEMTATALVNGTRRGGGRGTSPELRRAEITVLDVFGPTASVRIDAGEWVDYLHLVDTARGWRIVNVLWQPR